MNRSVAREFLFRFVYHLRIQDLNLSNWKEHTQDFQESNDLSITNDQLSDVESLLIFLSENQNELIKQVDEKSTRRKYNSLDQMVQNALLVSLSEKEIFETPRKVIINESVELVKKYSDDKNAKVVNGILDTIL